MCAVRTLNATPVETNAARDATLIHHRTISEKYLSRQRGDYARMNSSAVVSASHATTGSSSLAARRDQKKSQRLIIKFSDRQIGLIPTCISGQ